MSFPCSSEEPDEKKLLTEEAGLASAQLMDGDMQVNQAAYNYNAWYQVWSCQTKASSCGWVGDPCWVCSVSVVLLCGTLGVPLSCVPGLGLSPGSNSCSALQWALLLDQQNQLVPWGSSSRAF